MNLDIQAPALDEASVTAAFRTPQTFLAVRGGKIAHWSFGSGPDLLLVHGWPLHAATFRRIIPALARHFTVHAIDLPRVGRSSAIEGPANLENHARTVRAVADALHLKRFAYLAHDSGGGIARFAAAGDDRVRALVLGNTEIPHEHGFNFQMLVALAKLGLGGLVVRSLGVGALRRGPLGFGGCFTDARYADGEFFDLFVRPLLDSRELADGQIALGRDFDFALIDRLEEIHARLAMPVQMIWGTDDPFFPLPKARAMTKQFAGRVELVEIPGAKLFAHEDHPEEFADHAVRFLRRALS